MSATFRLLLTAATPAEIEPTLVWLRAQATYERRNVLVFGRAEIEVLFTGVGPVAAAYALGFRFGAGDLPGLAIQAGVGGAIDRSLPLTEVVQVVSERLGDTGAGERDGSWLSLGDIGLPPGEPFGPDEVLRLPSGTAPTPFPTVEGITVAQTTGSTAGLAHLRARWPEVQVESMEGAAFFRACLDVGVSPVQLRSISNYVEARDRGAWKLPEAIRSLNDGLQSLLSGFV